MTVELRLFDQGPHSMSPGIGFLPIDDDSRTVLADDFRRAALVGDDGRQARCLGVEDRKAERVGPRRKGLSVGPVMA